MLVIPHLDHPGNVFKQDFFGQFLHQFCVNMATFLSHRTPLQRHGPPGDHDRQCEWSALHICRWVFDITKLVKATHDGYYEDGFFGQSVSMSACDGDIQSRSPWHYFPAGLCQPVPAAVLYQHGDLAIVQNKVALQRHGPPGDHDRHDDLEELHIQHRFYDIMDVIMQMNGSIEAWLMAWGPILGHAARVAVLTMLLIQTLALVMVLLTAMRSRWHPLRAPFGRLCWLCVMVHEVQATTSPPRRRPEPPPRPTDLELWAGGQLTIREQFARAIRDHILAHPLERSNGEAPLPDFYHPPDDEMPPLRVVPANAVHVTLWTTTPYYEAETVDVELNFPLSMHMVRRALKESFTVIPDWAGEVIPTTPQLGDDFASFIAFPGWLEQANMTVQVIDARDVHGPVFSC